ncbi:MAG TPA: hypothetical protein DCY89_01515 [Gammaproteobacteria bacterium]|nr:hypothetical protein [Gammaproteobacteria bacterium]
MTSALSCLFFLSTGLPANATVAMEPPVKRPVPAAEWPISATMMRLGVEPAVRSRLAGEEVGESAAAAAAQAATGGRVVAVRRSGATYEVTVLLDDGQVRVLRIDAQSGQVVGG